MILTSFKFTSLGKPELGFTANLESNGKTPASALGELLDFGEAVTQSLLTVTHDDPGRAPCAFTAEASPEEIKAIVELAAKASEGFPLAMESPFEGTHLIAGAVWHGSLVEDSRCDALVSLEWAPGCTALPAHTHDYSDRLIIIPSGAGSFYTSIASSENEMELEVPLSPGSLVAFSRGVRHTFATGDQEMKMLSYHVPFVSLENRRQYTVLSPEWRPSAS